MQKISYRDQGRKGEIKNANRMTTLKLADTNNIKMFTFIVPKIHVFFTYVRGRILFK